ncbi:hypothetical protein [Maribellus sediminis]|uniref:hypothetical protein n=1 Tax=Maribellus sediminis TaxID=2696285 RepID=UPI00143035C1|nr:hypothetical protein [Maribellus sediminis]
MRKLYFIVLLLLAFIACEDREPDPVVIPVWLEARISELEDSGCVGCNIRRYTYKEEYFYHVYCNYWSCIDCEIYHYDGEPVDWEYTDRADFWANKNRTLLLWECPVDSTSQP